MANREQILTDLDHILRGTCHKKPLQAAVAHLDLDRFVAEHGKRHTRSLYDVLKKRDPKSPY